MSFPFKQRNIEPCLKLFGSALLMVSQATADSKLANHGEAGAIADCMIPFAKFPDFINYGEKMASTK